MGAQTTRTLTRVRQLELSSLGLLVLVAVLIPEKWDRVEFLIFLFIPILLSTKYFDFEKETFKRSLAYLVIFIFASLASYLLHVWQLKWELNNPGGLFGWQLKVDQLFLSIPFNDGMWLRQLAHPFLNEVFVTIYIHGFVLCLFVLCIYYVLTGQPNKILHALFCGYFIQYILILPFHFWVDGHQVWLIQNQLLDFQFTDPIKGHRSITDVVIPSLNHVFPSMHTSIATTVILLSLRESSLPIKYFFVTLNVAIIISTVYLGIHWIIDVFGGIIFGYLIFKLGEKIVYAKSFQNMIK